MTKSSHPLARDLDHILAHTGDLWQHLRGRRVFITGGTGFVGTWLVESFLWANRHHNLGGKMFVLTRNPEAFRAEAPSGISDPAMELVVGDVTSFAAPAGEFPFVIHGSTELQMPPDAKAPTGMFDKDITATRHILQFARLRGVERFLFTSSGAAYGPQPPSLDHVSEDYTGAPATTNSNAAYGQAKHIGEWLCTMYAQQYGFAALIPRLFAFVGPHLPLDRNYAVGNFIRDVGNGGPVRIAGDGSPFRSYLYAADLAIWLWNILLRGQSARLYNVGSPHPVSIRELAQRVVQVTVPETRIEVALDPTPGVLPARYVPSTDRARDELGLTPLVSLEEGIRRTYMWSLGRPV